MNFEVIPDVKWSWGYHEVLGLCVAVAAVIYIWFKRKRWL